MRPELTRHSSRDVDEVQRHIRSALEHESGLAGVEIVPHTADYSRELSAIRFGEPGREPVFAIERVRHSSCQVTLWSNRRSLVVGFAHHGPVFIPVSHPSGHGHCVYAHAQPNVWRVPKGADSLNIVLSESVLRRLAQTFANEAQPLDQTIRLLIWADKRYLEGFVRSVWGAFAPAFETDPPAAASPPARDFAADLDEALFLDLYTHLFRGTPFTRRPDAGLVAQCQEILTAVRVRAVSTRELAAAVGASQQRVHESFLAITGMALRDWHLYQRLGHVRTGLKQASPYHVKVADIARAYGFRHLGRFSETYRRVFSEYPSATLKYGG